MQLYKDDSIDIQLVNKEIYINYYMAGKWIAEIKTDNLYDYLSISVELAG
jgi:hypothetical protein